MVVEGVAVQGADVHARVGGGGAQGGAGARQVGFEEHRGDRGVGEGGLEFDAVGDGGFDAGVGCDESCDGEPVGVRQVRVRVVGGDEFAAFFRDGRDGRGDGGVELVEARQVGGRVGPVGGLAVGIDGDQRVADDAHVRLGVVDVVPQVGVDVAVDVFAEDGLRILRGLRFAAELGFAVEPETAAALRRNAPRLQSLSPERVRTELQKLLCGRAAAPVLREYIEVIGVVLPELLPMVGFAQNNPHHNRDVWEHTLTVLENIPAEPVLRWAALLHDAEKPACCTVDAEGIRHFHGHQQKSAETAEAILRRLHCETRLIADVTELIKIHDIRFPATVETATRWAGRWGEKRFLQFTELRRAGEAEPYYRALRAAYDEAKRQDACFTVRQLAVSGDDLTGLGLSGPAVGETLRRLLWLVQGGTLPNERAALLAAARQQE